MEGKQEQRSAPAVTRNEHGHESISIGGYSIQPQSRRGHFNPHVLKGIIPSTTTSNERIQQDLRIEAGRRDSDSSRYNSKLHMGLYLNSHDRDHPLRSTRIVSYYARRFRPGSTAKGRLTDVTGRPRARAPIPIAHHSKHVDAYEVTATIPSRSTSCSPWNETLGNRPRSLPPLATFSALKIVASGARKTFTIASRTTLQEKPL